MVFVNTTYPQEASRDNILRYFEAIDNQDLDSGAGGAAFNSSTTFNTRNQLQRILLHWNAAYTGTLTITYDSRNGVNFDTVISTQALVGVTDVVVDGDLGIDIFQQGDEINIQVSAGAGFPDVFVTVLATEIP